MVVRGPSGIVVGEQTRFPAARSPRNRAVTCYPETPHPLFIVHSRYISSVQHMKSATVSVVLHQRNFRSGSTKSAPGRVIKLIEQFLGRYFSKSWRKYDVIHLLGKDG